MPDKPQRAVIEYRVTPMDGANGKAKVFQRVIEDVVTPTDAEKTFWNKPIWPRATRQVEILEIRWPEEE